MKFIYIVEKTIFVTDKKGNTKVIPAGTRLSAKEYANLPSDNARAKCREEVFEYAPKVRFSNDELDVAIALYQKYTVGESSACDNPVALAEFQVRFPKRTSASANMLFTQIRGLDAYVPQGGLSCQGKTLVRKLYEIDPDRFPKGEKNEVESSALLDSLLADIRG